MFDRTAPGGYVTGVPAITLPIKLAASLAGLRLAKRRQTRCSSSLITAAFLESDRYRVASFTMAVTLISATLFLLTAPIVYLVGDISIPAWSLDFSVTEKMSIGGWDIDTLSEAFLLTLAGIPTVFISLHLMNAIAALSGRMAKVMLAKLD